MMEFGGSKFLHSLVLGTLLLVSIIVSTAWTQTTSAWTFNIPGQSFLSFSPVYSNTQDQRISLNFRTRNPNGLIFCHYLKDLDITELKRINYKMCGELQYGSFVLDYQLMQFHDDGLTLGKALHNDQWHSLDVHINVTSGELTVTLDKETRVTTLRSYTRQDFTTLLDWSEQSSAIYFGGTDPDTLFSDFFPHFIGCMSELQFGNQEGNLVPVPVAMVNGVVQGCTDLCTDSPCHHGGRCINQYTKAACDCFGSDYQGDFCSELGPTKVTLRGYEWITYSMYRQEENILTDQIRFSLEFKTSRGSGVLFYAVGGAPYHSHVTASVHAGMIFVSVGFGNEDIDVQTGIGVDNYRWHNLTIEHFNRTVNVYLDGRRNTRKIFGSIVHLALAPQVFIGGGEDFIITRGLQVTQNFVGCLKNIYVNDISVLYQLAKHDPQAQYYGGGSVQPHYACEEVVNIPLSFPTSASMLMLQLTEDNTNKMEVEFDFKTVREEAILIYASLVDMDTSIEFNYGYIEVWIKHGQPLLKFVPSTKTKYQDRIQELLIPTVVNDNVWNTMKLTFSPSEVKLKVNGISATSEDIGRTFSINSKIVVGYGFNKYKDSEGYVGCIRNLKFQGDLKDALDLLETPAVTGLVIDGCNITDYCQDYTMCEHGGKCLSEWSDVACDCTDTYYTGRACHFSKYKRTCDEYYQAGANTTGVMLLDLDGSGPLDPVHVQCNMGFESGLEFFGKTIVDHNLQENTTVRKPMIRDLKKLIDYRELNRTHLMKLTEESGWCEQYIRYDCKHSPIRLGKLTWFKAANGEMVEYLGTDQGSPGFCSCSKTDSCAGDRCNCDNETFVVQHDEGYNRVIEQLPLVEITVKQEDNPLDPASANMTLGPLVCWGNKNYKPIDGVTFGSEDGYLLNHAWQNGDLSISFRTHHSKAMLLYQTGTRRNINYFLVAVTSDSVIKFLFRWGRKQLEVDIVSPVPVSNGQWHQVTIETDRHNIRCVLDMTEKIVDIPKGVPKVSSFSGILYIGGVPDSVVKDDIVAEVPGIVGCMRGLHYNELGFSLSSLIDSSTKDVYKECMASCWPNPCKNGAECKERWGAHQCVCVNQWAHSGHNCEIDINTDAVTFLGDSTSHLHFFEPKQNLLDSTIVFSFRTFLKDALLFYMHDHNNNFVQVDVHGGKKVVAQFNRYNIILEQSKTVDGSAGFLDDGKWNQVVIDNTDGYIKVIVNVDDEPSRNSYRKQKLETYSQTPFIHEETVKPVRPATPPDPGIHVYVGGVPAGMTSYPYLIGCIRGLKIGSKVFQLHETALKTPGVADVCDDGCLDNPCKNGGICEEEWQDKQFTCDCSFSEFAGPTCDTEASGWFLGDSILQYKYNPPTGAEMTTTERLEFVFQVHGDLSNNMVLAFIYSERYVTHDFMIVYLDPRNGVYVSINVGYAMYGVGKSGRFADGKPHQLLYRRSGGEMILTVRSESHPKYKNPTISLDEEGIGRVTVADNTLDDLDTIMIGGILGSQFAKIPDTADYSKYSNFTGCISEVRFFPNGDLPFALRPLKDLRDSLNTSGVATIFGSNIGGCNTGIINVPKATSTPKPTVAPTDMPSLTFPPWNPGPAETVYFGDPPVIPTAAPPTRLTTPRTSTAMETEMVDASRGNKHDDKIVAIALAIVAFLLILSVIIAIILLRIRRRERKEEEKKKKQDLEMKQPLNHQDTVAINDNHQNQNYLARLDEFSMVSATLGARPPKKDGLTTFKPPSDSSYTYSSVPNTEADDHAPEEQRFYNRKKNRPASSISEVLEEMERQRNNKDIDPEDLETLGSTPLQHVPNDSAPLSCHRDDLHHMNPIQEDFIYSMLPPGGNATNLTEIHAPDHHNSDSLTSTETHDDDVENDADNESDTPSPPPPLNVGLEYNGDSGYEAESKPDEEEEETLMNSSYHGNGSYQGDVAPNSPDSHAFTPPSPDSKTSNYMSDNVSPLTHSDMSSGKTSPTTPDSKVMIYGLPTPVIERESDLAMQKPGILTNGAEDT